MPTLARSTIVVLASAFMMAGQTTRADVPDYLVPHLVNYYSFDNQLGGSALSPTEVDLGLDATNIQLLNGGRRA
jgi:hypothetical protein